jgi:hypothetical protein
VEEPFSFDIVPGEVDRPTNAPASLDTYGRKILIKLIHKDNFQIKPLPE